MELGISRINMSNSGGMQTGAETIATEDLLLVLGRLVFTGGRDLKSQESLVCMCIAEVRDFTAWGEIQALVREALKRVSSLFEQGYMQELSVLINEKQF